MIMDVHVHLPSPGWSGHESFLRTPARSVEYMKKAGVHRAIFNTWQGVLAKTADDLTQANRAALRLAARHANFLYPAAVIHPDFPEESAVWLKKFHQRGLKWVGELVPRRGMEHPYTDASFLRLAEQCMEYGQVLHLHYHHDVIKLAQCIPECRIVVAHIPEQPVLAEIAKQPNLWLDIAGLRGGLCVGVLERALQVIGVERLLFGTDFDSYEPRAFVARVRVAIHSRNDLRKIYWTNAHGLLANEN